MRNATLSGDRHSLLLFALAAGGVAFLLLQLVVGIRMGLFPWPGGDAYVWDRVGDEMRAGVSPYGLRVPLTDSFFYAPPWAVLFAAVSWLPVEAQAAGLLAVKIVSLRLIAGSWRGAGIACWFPLVAFDLAGGNFNLLLAAAIVLAIEGRPGLAVFTGLAKIGPAAAIHPRDWRPAAVVAAISVAVTIPWLTLWPIWLAQMIGAFGTQLGPMIPVPFVARAAVATMLLLAWRPWSRALAAVLLIPAFYYGSLVVLIAPVAVVVRRVGAKGGVQSMADPDPAARMSRTA